jgi:hypothetical protein
VLVVTAARVIQTNRTGRETAECLATTEEIDRGQQMALIEELIDTIFKKNEMIKAQVTLQIVRKEISIDQEEKQMTYRHG